MAEVNKHGKDCEFEIEDGFLVVLCACNKKTLVKARIKHDLIECYEEDRMVTCNCRNKKGPVGPRDGQ